MHHRIRRNQSIVCHPSSPGIKWIKAATAECLCGWKARISLTGCLSIRIVFFYGRSCETGSLFSSSVIMIYYQNWNLFWRGLPFSKNCERICWYRIKAAGRFLPADFFPFPARWWIVESRFLQSDYEKNKKKGMVLKIGSFHNRIPSWTCAMKRGNRISLSRVSQCFR